MCQVAVYEEGRLNGGVFDMPALSQKPVVFYLPSGWGFKISTNGITRLFGVPSRWSVGRVGTLEFIDLKKGTLPPEKLSHLLVCTPLVRPESHPPLGPLPQPLVLRAYSPPAWLVFPFVCPAVQSIGFDQAVRQAYGLPSHRWYGLLP